MFSRTVVNVARRAVQIQVKQNVYHKQFLIPASTGITKFRFFTDQTDMSGKILDKARTEITDDLKKELNATMIFKISGKNYLLEALADKPLKVELVETAPEKVDVTLITDENTFVNMAKGKTKATTAFMSGKLKIKGNVSIAMKAEKLFKAMKVE